MVIPFVSHSVVVSQPFQLENSVQLAKLDMPLINGSNGLSVTYSASDFCK